ncbi:MAG: hypothetical protein KGR42_07920 [Acidobacteria bacterium]|nr:hypothetical protein [Acidobacteriota bacterium]
MSSPRHLATSRRDPATNSGITNATAVLLLLALFAEGLTIPLLPGSVTLHAALGAALMGPVALKSASTAWRMIHYYLGESSYVEKGPPPLVLRLLGPFVGLLTWVVLVSGVVLMVPSWRSVDSLALFVHKASFVLWFGAMAIHVLGHLPEIARYVSRAGERAARRYAWTVALAVLVGIVIAGAVAQWGSWNPGGLG